MVKNDRLLVLEQTSPKATGILDPRVFKGGNSIHAVMDSNTTMWTLRMEHGLVPAPLRNKYTDFNALLKHAKDYFSTKNIQIKEVIY